MKTTLRAITAVALTCLLALSAVAQNPATYGSSAGRYGITSWAVNGQRVASQFNYDIDSVPA